MIKKLILIVTVCLFAAGSIINMHLAQNDHNTDISLADISVMAQADGENGGGDPKYCYLTGGGIWVYARTCIDPDYPTLPRWQCGSTQMIYNGLRLEQCW